MEEQGGFGQRKLRISTWNVNGIRNPFGYQPWREKRTFAAMFDILEADIVIMQETKIQRKDLRDDMVLVPGWDVYFSLPKHKKGYSGVVIYTRSSVCAPIKAEEGVTGVLTPPNSSISFCDLPEDQQIGGYPRPNQVEECSLDFATLDSEGRCVILEFPAFIMIGVYCPANRDETRDDFRVGFLNALDVRIRNLVALGKRVFLAGDLNIIRDAIDTANAAEQLKKNGLTIEQYISTPARRMLNQLLVDGRVIGDRDEGRERGILTDICRKFHPGRAGMFTCWEQKTNARPGNFGSRIDYVLCSEAWSDWFCDANIQEGLMGSDHCPVYATLKGAVSIDGKEVDIRDVMSSEMYVNGIRQREWSAKDLLPMSAKLIPEFDRRRSIRDMFAKKPSMLKSDSSIQGNDSEKQSDPDDPQLPGVWDAIEQPTSGPPISTTLSSTFQTSAVTTSPKLGEKRPRGTSTSRSTGVKKSKSVTSNSKAAPAAKKGQPGKGQSSLMGFFKHKTPEASSLEDNSTSTDGNGLSKSPSTPATSTAPSLSAESSPADAPRRNGTTIGVDMEAVTLTPFVDPIKSKESWSKLLGKRVVPKCEHDEPCISQLTKKPGINCGRSFYMCPRPLGPSGKKERNTQWRCGTFVWSSDWIGDGT